MVTIYGIPNCDIVKKSLAWFKEKKIAYEFHNFKTQEVSRAKLLDWINKAGLEVVVNKRSATWRNLKPETQMMMADTDKAIGILMSETSIIKRPVIESKRGLVVGFNEEVFQNKFID